MNPIIILIIILGIITLTFILAFAFMKNKKEAFGFDRNMKDSIITKRLLQYALPYFKSFLLVLALMLFTVASDIVLPLIISSIVGILKEINLSNSTYTFIFATKNIFTINASYSSIISLVIIYITILLISQIFSFIQAIILQKTGQKIISKLREELFSHIEKLSHSTLNQIPVGTFVTRVCNDTAAVSNMFTSLIVNLVKNFFVVIGVLIAMLCINIKLSLVVLCFVPLIILYTIIFRKFSRKAYREVKKDVTDINIFLSENLEGIKITQIFNQENKKFKDFNQRNNHLEKSKTKQIFVFGVFRPAIYLLYISSMISIFYIGSNDALKGIVFAGQIISAETIVAFYQYISTFYNPIQNLADQFNRLQAAYASAEKIFTILDLPLTIVDDKDAISLDTIKGDIEFKNVWFAYNDENWILKDVSFKIKAKQTVAFVGSTGSGKTTILSLIVRNYDIQKGQILIDGIDIKKIKIDSLRKHFGQMLQDVFIFSGTIRSNIVLKNEDISDETIKKACKYVNADRFINKLEHGLDEVVRERGNNFSAGQRQLLSFARTIVHKPEIIILDEATANIDTETELLIQNSLEKMLSIGTTLMVAHRLSTIQHADKIIVLSHGQIIEEGSHQQLLKLKGSYYNLYKLQYHKEQLLK